MTACRPYEMCVSRVTASGGIKQDWEAKELPAAGGFGSVGVFSSHLSLGEAAQWSHLAIRAGGTGG